MGYKYTVMIGQHSNYTFELESLENFVARYGDLYGPLSLMLK